MNSFAGFGRPPEQQQVPGVQKPPPKACSSPARCKGSEMPFMLTRKFGSNSKTRSRPPDALPLSPPVVAAARRPVTAAASRHPSHAGAAPRNASTRQQHGSRDPNRRARRQRRGTGAAAEVGGTALLAPKAGCLCMLPARELLGECCGQPCLSVALLLSLVQPNSSYTYLAGSQAQLLTSCPTWRSTRSCTPRCCCTTRWLRPTTCGSRKVRWVAGVVAVSQCRAACAALVTHASLLLPHTTAAPKAVWEPEGERARLRPAPGACNAVGRVMSRCCCTALWLPLMQCGGPQGGWRAGSEGLPQLHIPLLLRHSMTLVVTQLPRLFAPPPLHRPSPIASPFLCPAEEPHHADGSSGHPQHYPAQQTAAKPDPLAAMGTGPPPAMPPRPTMPPPAPPPQQQPPTVRIGGGGGRAGAPTPTAAAAAAAAEEEPGSPMLVDLTDGMGFGAGSPRHIPLPPSAEQHWARDSAGAVRPPPAPQQRQQGQQQPDWLTGDSYQALGRKVPPPPPLPQQRPSAGSPPDAGFFVRTPTAQPTAAAAAPFVQPASTGAPAMSTPALAQSPPPPSPPAQPSVFR